MEDEEFLGSLTSAWLGEERRSAPRETLLEQIARRGPDAMRAEIEPLVDYYDELASYLPEAGEIAEALVDLLDNLSGDAAPACARLQELHARHAEVLRAELGCLEVRPSYSPWVDSLRAQLQAFVRGQQTRAPIYEHLAELEQLFSASLGQNQSNARQLGSRASEATRKVLELSEQGYSRGHSATRALIAALERRDLEAIGEGLRALNQAFSYLTQARELCELEGRQYS